MLSDLLPGMDRLVLDNVTGEVVVTRVDGRELRGVAPGETVDVPSDPVARVTVHVQQGLVVLQMRNGQEVTVEQYAFDDQVERRNGRATLYLDQNKWIQVAQAIHSPDRLSATGLDAARLLIERVRAQELIVLLSGGHWVETGPTFGGRRERLATTMVDLSRGWLLEDPLQVRMAELSNLLRRDADPQAGPAAPEVITLNYRALMSGIGDDSAFDCHLPPVLLAMQDVLSGANAVLSVLLDTERVAATEDRSAEWADSQAFFAKELARPEARRHARDLTRTWFLKDLGQHLPSAAFLAGHDEETFKAWWSTSEEALATAPYLSRSREVMHRRLMNTSNRWERNDLVDLMFLPLAAAYADHVVCERKTALDLRAVASSVPPGATIHRTIEELLDNLG